MILPVYLKLFVPATILGGYGEGGLRLRSASPFPFYRKYGPFKVKREKFFMLRDPLNIRKVFTLRNLSAFIYGILMEQGGGNFHKIGGLS